MLPNNRSNERGMAMITTLLVMMLLSALMVGFTAVVMSDQRYRFIDRDRGQAFYAASGGIEKLTADLGNLFFTNVAPTAAQVAALTVAGKVPTMPGVTFTNPSAPQVLPTSSLTKCANPAATSGAPGYTIMFCPGATGNPAVSVSTPIKTGPYEGLIAQQTPYQMDVSARTATGGEVHLVRTTESVAIPVFQFGMFSDVDLSFSAAANFDFGGRVHTNGNLYLAETGGATLTLRDKVTAVKEVVRQRLSNGVSIDTVGQTGTVNMAKSPSAFAPLPRDHGSVVDGPASAQNEPIWHTTSLSDYNSWIRNGRTGAKPLNLPLITVGGTNPDLVRRPAIGEDVAKPVLYGERLYSKASLRILLSDTAVDITNLPTVTAIAPVQLGGDWNAAPPNNGTAYGPVNAATGHPPIALSPGYQATANVNTNAGDTVINVVVPPYFRPATMQVGAMPAVVCTGRGGPSVNQFLGCAPVPAANVATGTLVSATINGQVVTTTLNGAWAAGSTTMTVQNGGTAPFAPGVFFIGRDLVSCTGVDVADTQFTGCAGVRAAVNLPVTTQAMSAATTGLIDGFIKIERQDGAGAWIDVTMEILNYGVGAANLAGTACADPSPNAILRLQRLKDNAGGTTTTNGGGCGYAADTTGYRNPANWWPNALFDAREAVYRDTNYPGANNLTLAGVMYYVSLDVQNLSQWFRGAGAFNGGTGLNSKTDNGGYTVYFSDRRNNRNALNQETGEYGYEDFVNPGVANGVPNNVLNPGEDVNANTLLDSYGGIPNAGNGVAGSTVPGAGAIPGNPLVPASRPTTTLLAPQAMVNRAIIFRRALKLVRGSNIAGLNVTGLTVVSENPVYIHGDWNVVGGTFAGAHAATSVIGDTVAVLSNNWNDATSFAQPYVTANRPRAADSWYRVAIISGKSAIFSRPGDVAAASTFGTDGGAHSFLRMLEGGGGTTVHYRGSMATFFYNRQALGQFKCCGGVVYDVPVRDFTFDLDFLSPALLPPNTPVFRDMNTVGFSQELRPGR